MFACRSIGEGVQEREREREYDFMLCVHVFACVCVCVRVCAEKIHTRDQGFFALSQKRPDKAKSLFTDVTSSQ